MNQPDRVAAAWRQACQAYPLARDAQVSSLGGLVETFLRELGLSLTGKPGSPWSRALGVLRLSSSFGPRLLYDEFAALRRCLEDALEVLGAEAFVRRQIHAALDEAVDSAVGLWQHLSAPSSPLPSIRPPGAVVAVFEKQPKQAAAPRSSSATPLH